MPVSPKSLIHTLLLALALTGLTACSGSSQDQANGPKSRPAIPVTVATVQQKDMPVTIKAVGNVEAYATVALKSRVTGPIVAVHFEEGREVRAGDLLFTIDPVPFQVALKQAEAQLARDKALSVNARMELQRNVSLVEKGILSPLDYDQLKAKADSLDAAVQGHLANIEKNQLQIDYCSLKAPVSGRTGSIQAPVGTLVKANDDNKILVTLTQVQPIYVSFTVPEKYLGRINQALNAPAAVALPEKYLGAGKAMASGGLTAEVELPDGPEGAPPIPGRVSFVDNAVDTATGTIRLKATMPNLDRSLWPGQFVRVRLIIDMESGALVVPNQAVQAGQAGQFVFVLGADDLVELRPVTVSLMTSTESVIAVGLKPGETVVTDGQLNLVSGTKVTVKAEASAATDGGVSERIDDH